MQAAKFTARCESIKGYRDATAFMRVSKLLQCPTLIEPFGGTIASLFDSETSKARQIKPYVIVWWLFAASVVVSNIPRIFGEISGPLSYVVAIGGAAGCGWAWLFSRTMFRATKPLEPWTIAAVGAVVVIESYWEIAAGWSAGGLAAETNRIAGNAASLVCLGAIVLVFVEALSGYNARMPRSERRFRESFVLVLGAIVAVSILWASNADGGTLAARWHDAALAGCGFAGVIAGRIAVSFRLRNPIIAGPLPGQSKSPSPLTAGDEALARRILEAIEDEKVFTTPDLKIAEFAKALGEHDYKVTQCITGLLKYRNFNHLINSRRVERAKRILSDTRNEGRPILSIAFECGFNSIGPFNRAFKQEVGMTPREFRARRSK